MTRYTLPDGVQVDRSDGDLPAANEFAWVNHPRYGFIQVLAAMLTEVKPPPPPQPPVGSVVLDAKGMAWQHVDVARDRKVWWCTKDVLDETWTELNAQYGPLTLLVPDPFAEPVELPWTNKFLRVSRSNDPTYPAAVSFGSHGANGLNRETALEMARALWSAAAEEKP